MREPYLWRTANMSWRTCVVVKQMQSNPRSLHGPNTLNTMNAYWSRQPKMFQNLTLLLFTLQAPSAVWKNRGGMRAICLFNAYVVACESRGIKPRSPKLFGRVAALAFPSVTKKTKRNSQNKFKTVHGCEAKTSNRPSAHDAYQSEKSSTRSTPKCICLLAQVNFMRLCVVQQICMSGYKRKLQCKDWGWYARFYYFHGYPTSSGRFRNFKQTRLQNPPNNL